MGPVRQAIRLCEATRDVRQAVQRIIKVSGLDTLIAANARGAEALRDRLKAWPAETIHWRLHTGDLVELSDEIARAHAVNPATLLVGRTRQGSYYMPTSTAAGDATISISIKDQVAGIIESTAMVLKPGEDLRAAVDRRMSAREQKSFWNEFSEIVLGGTIAHELTHWIDDSLGNRFLTKRVDRANERKNPAVMRGRYADVYHTPMETNAMIAAIRHIADEVGAEEYDRLTWYDLAVFKPGVMRVFADIADDATYAKVFNTFLRRMAREGLIGAGMRKPPSQQRMQILLNR